MVAAWIKGEELVIVNYNPCKKLDIGKMRQIKDITGQRVIIFIYIFKGS